jgi:hypothetical protein
VEDAQISRMTARSEKLMLLQDVDGFSISESTITSRDSLVKMDDARNIRFEQVKFVVPGGQLAVEPEGTLNVAPVFKDCTYEATAPEMAPEEADEKQTEK